MKKDYQSNYVTLPVRVNIIKEKQTHILWKFSNYDLYLTHEVNRKGDLGVIECGLRECVNFRLSVSRNRCGVMITLPYLECTSYQNVIHCLGAMVQLLFLSFQLFHLLISKVLHLILAHLILGLHKN